MPETNETQNDLYITLTPGRVDIKISQPNSIPPTKDALSTTSDLTPLTENRVRSFVKRVFSFFWNTFFE